MKEKVLKMILEKIEKIESNPERLQIIVDTIDIVALKELYNDILNIE